MLNGGTLKALNLQMDGGGDGIYKDLIGPEPTCLDPIFTVLTGINPGTTYLFRYRVMNDFGWSDFSPVTAIAAASVPSSPPKPVVVSVSSTQVQLSFSQPSFDGGSPLSKYELYVND